MRYIYCIFLYMPLIIDICQSGMEIGLAWCGGASARGFKVRVLRWRSGWAAFAAGVVERSEISEISEHSEGLADARL